MSCRELWDGWTYPRNVDMNGPACSICASSKVDRTEG